MASDVATLDGRTRNRRSKADPSPHLRTRARAPADGSLGGSGQQPLELEVPIVSLGAGLGSFALVDLVRVSGLSHDSIKVIGPEADPFAALATTVLPTQDKSTSRMRSDSAARIDSIWGWPGYATSEAIALHSPVPVIRTAVEPVLAEYYVPSVRGVRHGLERELDRIGWERMHVAAEVHSVYPHADGGFTVLASESAANSVGSASGTRSSTAFHCRYLHLALGHAGPRYLPDLIEYRSTSPSATLRAVTAYEPHEHVYNDVAARGGCVVVRGGGMTAMHALERLATIRLRTGAPITIVQVVPERGDNPVGQGPPVREGISYQPFTFPKAANGGQVHARLARMPPAERADHIRVLGAPSTPEHRQWERLLARGREEGWFERLIGEARILPDDSGSAGDGGSLCVGIVTGAGLRHMAASYVVDCTGLRSGAADHPVLAQLVRAGYARCNDLGGIAVSPDFEVLEARSGNGRLFVSGCLALGCELAAVDSFWGLQYAALRIADRLAADGFSSRIGPMRSITGWLRWLRGSEP